MRRFATILTALLVLSAALVAVADDDLLLAPGEDISPESNVFGESSLDKDPLGEDLLSDDRLGTDPPLNPSPRSNSEFQSFSPPAKKVAPQS